MSTHGSDISSSLTANPENTHVSLFIELKEFSLIDGSHSELLFDSRDKWRLLEAGAGEGFESLLEVLDLVYLAMELDYSDVFFTG